MEIKKFTGNKAEFIDLLLLADEQESLVMHYLERGEMFLLEENGKVLAECVVTDEGDEVCEIKNIAVDSAFQRQGYGRMLVEYVIKHYSGKFSKVIVGTGDSPLTIPFYESCGFVQTYRVKNFFIDNYDHPIYEAGVQLIDMVYLEKQLI